MRAPSLPGLVSMRLRDHVYQPIRPSGTWSSLACWLFGALVNVLRGGPAKADAILPHCDRVFFVTQVL